MVQHLSMFDYVAVSGTTQDRVIEYVDHLHEHFTEPVRIRNGHYAGPNGPWWWGSDAGRQRRHLPVPRRSCLERRCLTLPSPSTPTTMCGIPASTGTSGWTSPDLASLRRSFSMADYRIAAQAGVAGRTVVRTVVVQTLASVSETRDLLALAGADELVGAVVGWIDLTDPGCGEVLDELSRHPAVTSYEGCATWCRTRRTPNGS